MKLQKRTNIALKLSFTFTRSKFSDVTEKRPFICTRLAFDLSSRESLNPVEGEKECYNININPSSHNTSTGGDADDKNKQQWF